jgi:predicted RNA binding protein YcfA (HicA-like mRNA interferase family)
MGRLPSLSVKEVVRIFERLGYQKHRQRGSHLIMIHDKMNVQPVIPIHGGDIKKGTLRALIRQSGLTVDEFLNYRR